MRFSTKDLVTLAVFGALWGSVEMSLGAWLHAANVPFTGLLLSAVGVCIALIGYVFVPRAGAVFMISLVAAMLKAFSVGGVGEKAADIAGKFSVLVLASMVIIGPYGGKVTAAMQRFAGLFASNTQSTRWLRCMLRLRFSR